MEIDGEKIRERILQRPTPDKITLGTLVKELIGNSSYLDELTKATFLLKNPNPDYELLKDTFNSRIEGLYAELDRREEQYKKQF